MENKEIENSLSDNQKFWNKLISNAISDICWTAIIITLIIKCT